MWSEKMFISALKVKKNDEEQQGKHVNLVASSSVVLLGRPPRPSSSVVLLGRPPRSSFPVVLPGRPPRSSSSAVLLGRPPRPSSSAVLLGRPPRPSSSAVLLGRPPRSSSPVVHYFSGNVQGPGCPIDPSEITLRGCSCLSRSCCTETCSCLQIYGQAYDATGRLLDLSRADSGCCSPVFECNALCSCSDACSNRVVQKGLQFSLEVFHTRNKGWGVRPLEEIRCGTFVCEYAGEVIDFEEARRRQLTQTSEENNYIIAVREHAATGSVTETFVDPAQKGNVGRFLNHSCLPNLFMLPVRVHSVIPRLALFAGQDIKAHEELTFDYSGGYGNRRPAGLLSTQNAAAVQASGTEGLLRKVCHCGSSNCTHFLPLDLSVLR
ncbi:histone-lysine N-methyltransferase SETMAR [Xenentodon cancila]